MELLCGGSTFEAKTHRQGGYMWKKLIRPLWIPANPLKINAWWLSIPCLFLGIWFGNWFAIGFAVYMVAVGYYFTSIEDNQ